MFSPYNYLCSPNAPPLIQWGCGVPCHVHTHVRWRRVMSPPPLAPPHTHAHVCIHACTRVNGHLVEKRVSMHPLVTRCSLVKGRWLCWCTPPVKKWSSSVQRPPVTHQIRWHKWQSDTGDIHTDKRGNACRVQDLIGNACPADNCRNACAAIRSCTVIVV
jgi:hypothetical protein